MVKKIVPVLFCLVISSLAEPYMAMRSGMKCAQCHFNRSGGGLRTAFGNAYAQNVLPMQFLETKLAPEAFTGDLSEFVTVGANFRMDQEVSLKYSGTNPNNNQKVSASKTESLKYTESNVYTQFKLIPQHLSFYFDYDFYDKNNREMFVIFEGLPYNSYLKAGNTLSPYGFRLLDDDAFIRGPGTGYSYGRSAQSFEIGIEPGPISSITNFTPSSVSTVNSYTGVNWRSGFSLAYDTKGIRLLPKDKTTWIYGVFGGYHIGPFDFLAEIDFKDEQSNPADSLAKKAFGYVKADTWFSYFSIDYLPVKGFNMKLVYEAIHPNVDIDMKKNLRERVTFGVEPFISRYLQLGLFYQFNHWVPQNAEANQDKIIMRVHTAF